MFSVNIRTTPVTKEEIDKYMLGQGGNPEQIISYLRSIIRQYVTAKKGIGCIDVDLRTAWTNLKKIGEEMAIKITRVVNISGGRNRDILTANGFDIYIGRPGRWGNPFIMGQDGTRDAVCDKHLEWLDGKREAPNGQKPPTKEEIKVALTGKRLGCFCAPKRCHGDNYVAICRGKHG